MLGDDPLAGGILGPDPLLSGMLGPDPLTGQSYEDFKSEYQTYELPWYEATDEEIEQGIQPTELELKLSPFEAGIHGTQKMIWEALESGAQAAGMEVPAFIEQAIAENQEDIEAADIQTFFDKLMFGAGQLLPVIGATTAAAVIAPLMGGTAALGTTIGGGLTSLGMTLGDLQSKAKELDPEHVADIKQLGLGGALWLPDFYGISRAKHLLSPVRDIVKDSTVDQLKSARGLKNISKRLAKDSAIIGAAEGVQDVGTSVGANVVTGTDIDMSRVEAMANSAVEEALIGGILGAPLSGLNIMTANIAENQRNLESDQAAQILADQERNRLYQEEEGGEGSSLWDIRDDAGTVNTKATGELLDAETGERAPAMIPMPHAGKNPGLFTRAFNVLTGNVTDPVKRRHADNPYVQLLMQQINLSPEERRAGRTTLHEESTPWKGEVKFKIGGDFYAATKQEQYDAVQRKINGEADLSNPVDRALWEQLHGDRMHQLVTENTYGEVDVTEDSSLWQDETYFPINGTIDWKKIQNDPQWFAKLEQGMQEAGKSESQIAQMKVVVEKKLANFRKYGTDLSHSSQTPTKIESQMRSLIEQELEGETDITVVKAAINKIRNKLQGVSKESPLTLERALREAPQSWLDSYNRDGLDYAQVLGEHVDKNMEHLAHIKRFGMNDEIFHAKVGEAIVWGYENGKPLAPKDINDMYDALRVSKRMHLKPITQEWRDRQAMVRGLINTNLLGLSALVSIPEALSIPLATDIRTAVKAALSKAPMSDIQTVDTHILNESLNSAMQHVANRSNQDTVTMKRWEQWFIRNLTGLPQLQYFLSAWAAKAMDLHNRTLILDTMGTDTGKQNQAIVELSERGIDIEKAQAWAQAGFDMDNDYYVNEYIPNVGAKARDVIVDPDPVDKPKWHSDERLQLISQLKGFMTVFTNRVMRGHKRKIDRMTYGAGNRELALRLGPYITMYLLAQMAMQGVREVLSTGEVDDEQAMASRMWKAFGYLGASAYFVDPINAFMWRSSPIASTAGPATSMAFNLMRGGVESMVNLDPDAVVKEIVRTAIPNMPGMKAVEDVIIEGATGD